MIRVKSGKTQGFVAFSDIGRVGNQEFVDVNVNALPNQRRLPEALWRLR